MDPIDLPCLSGPLHGARQAHAVCFPSRTATVELNRPICSLSINKTDALCRASCTAQCSLSTNKTAVPCIVWPIVERTYLASRVVWPCGAHQRKETHSFLGLALHDCTQGHDTGHRTPSDAIMAWRAGQQSPRGARARPSQQAVPHGQQAWRGWRLASMAWSGEHGAPTMVSMARMGYLPLAVSPESITQSVPSNTCSHQGMPTCPQKVKPCPPVPFQSKPCR